MLKHADNRPSEISAFGLAALVDSSNKTADFLEKQGCRQFRFLQLRHISYRWLSIAVGQCPDHPARRDNRVKVLLRGGEHRFAGKIPQKSDLRKSTPPVSEASKNPGHA